MLRPQRVSDAAVMRQLWAERDYRVPSHRQLTADGRPSLEDIETHIASAGEPRLLSVELRESGKVIGYCGLVFHGQGRPDEPEIAFELLAASHHRGMRRRLRRRS